MAGARLELGAVFAGDYRVTRPLAEGGMGAVYVVEQLSTGKPRALKVMQGAIVADPRQRERFAQEARVGAGIESDHVVEVLAAGVDASTGLPWLAMELLEGADLAAVGARRGALAPVDVREVFEQLGHALAAAHRAGIVHRDLKPENVFVARSRRSGVPFTVKVLDFGIAKVLQESRSAATATSAIGSPLWMAPEQVRATRIGPPTDVWAVGLIAFWALTGRYYWLAANREGASIEGLLAEKLFDALPPASARAGELGVGEKLPQGFDAWFARAVCREYEARFADADAAVAALRALLPDDARAGGARVADTLAEIARERAAESAPTLAATAVADPPPGAKSAETVALNTAPARIAERTVVSKTEVSSGARGTGGGEKRSNEAERAQGTRAESKSSARTWGVGLAVVGALAVGTYFATRPGDDARATRHPSATPSAPAAAPDAALEPPTSGTAAANTGASATDAATTSSWRERGAAALEEAARAPGAVRLPSGVVYLEVRAGHGARPGGADRVSVTYRGTLVDGTEFDNSARHGGSASFPLNHVIPCWTEGVQQMRLGGAAHLVCPPETAYRDRSISSIPPNSTLVFDIELLAIGSGDVPGAGGANTATPATPRATPSAPAAPQGPPPDLSAVGRAGEVNCQYRRRENLDAVCQSSAPGYGNAWTGDHYGGGDSLSDADRVAQCGALTVRRFAGRCVRRPLRDGDGVCCR